MRATLGLVAALAYSLKSDPAPEPAPAIVEPWRPTGIPEEPDPVAMFVSMALKQYTGARQPLADVTASYRMWAEMRGQRPVDDVTLIDRLGCYVTIMGRPTGRYVYGHALHGLADRHLSPRSIPALRARMDADATQLATSLFATLQAARAILDPDDSSPEPIDRAAIAAAFIDEALGEACRAQGL